MARIANKENNDKAVLQRLKAWKMGAGMLPMLDKPLVHVLAIIFLVLIVYSNTFNAPFQLDDDTNIVENPAIRNFDCFTDPSKIDRVDLPIGARYTFKTRYIGYLTFALNYKLHGLDVWGFHLVNILVHIANALLVYWLIILTFRTPYFSEISGKEALFPAGSRNFIAAFAAFLFAVHPIETQAVTYIVQRFTSLAALFYLLSLSAYIRFRLSFDEARNPGLLSHRFKTFAGRSALYAGSLISAVLAMKTKELAFTLPLVMSIYEIAFFKGNMKRFLYLMPFLFAVLIIPLSLIGTRSLSEASGIASKVSGADGISRGDYLVTQIRVIVTYIRLLFLPINQNLDYDYPIYRSFFAPVVVVSCTSLLSVFSLAVFLIRLSRRTGIKNRYWHRLITFGIFWFFITVSAESGIIPIRDVIFEHRLYLPSIGFFIALTSAFGFIITKWGIGSGYRKNAVIFAIVLGFICLSAAAYGRNLVWKDSVSLWNNVVEGSPNKARAHNALGNAYTEQKRFDEAIKEYELTIKIDPRHADAHYNLGNVYTTMNRLDEAVRQYKAALKLRPDFVDAYCNLGVAYANQGRMGDAVGAYKSALEIKPDDADIRYNLANAYVSQGRLAEAVSEYKTVLRFNQHDPKVHYYLAAAYAKQQRVQEAVSEYEIVLTLNPRDAGTRKKLEILKERMK